MTTEDETVREMLEAFNAVPLFDGSGRMTTVAERLRAAYQAARRAVLEESDRLRDVLEKARALVAASDACDREAERPQPSRSSAPVVRHINAMAKLREAIRALASKETPLRDFQK